MFWITKYRHNEIVGHYKKTITDLREALNRKDLLTEIVSKLTDKTNDFISMSGAYVSSGAGVMAALDNTVPRYVDDYFGGRVIKQEATSVTILDANGKATYGLTARKPEKGKIYILHYSDKNVLGTM